MVGLLHAILGMPEDMSEGFEDFLRERRERADRTQRVLVGVLAVTCVLLTVSNVVLALRLRATPALPRADVAARSPAEPAAPPTRRHAASRRAPRAWPPMPRHAASRRAVQASQPTRQHGARHRRRSSTIGCPAGTTCRRGRSLPLRRVAFPRGARPIRHRPRLRRHSRPRRRPHSRRKPPPRGC